MLVCVRSGKRQGVGFAKGHQSVAMTDNLLANSCAFRYRVRDELGDFANGDGLSLDVY